VTFDTVVDTLELAPTSDVVLNGVMVEYVPDAAVSPP
jgi:hypothetical protein